MRERMQKALKTCGAEYAEIRIERTHASHVAYRGKDLDSVGSSSALGGIVRALYKGGWGMAIFNDINDLEPRVQEACEAARLVGCGTSYFAEVDTVEDVISAEMVTDFREIALKDKKELVGEYNEAVLGYSDRIETSYVSYQDRFRQIWFANTEGTWIEDERPDTGVMIQATARDGDNVQRAFESQAGTNGYDIVKGLTEKAAGAAKRAVELLDAPPVEGGTYPVVTNPKLTGVFAHEAFGHLSESDHVYENKQMKEIMVLGKEFGPKMLNIIDDGSIPGLRGTRKYDEEGVATRKNYLIKEGILTGRLHSRETAARMGEEPTGSARAIGYQHAPIVRMNNTYIDKGETPYEDIIKDIDLGVLAMDMVGGQTAMEMFTFSAAYGYMIRKGKVAELVRDVVLTGNVFETLQHVDMLGDTIEFPAAGGGCGKGGQSPLPVGFGGPYMRVQDIVVGGRQ